MELTKSQRWVAYCIMLAEFETKEENGYGLFLCRVFEHLCGVNMVDNEGLFKEILPELWDKRPKNNIIGSVWYYQTGDGYTNRIKALKQCIEETHP